MRSQRARRATAIFAASLFLTGLLVISPSATANPAIPSCGPASLPANNEQTQESYDPAMCEQLTGRVFPEAVARPEYLEADAAGHSNTGFASDFIGYFEFQEGLDYLVENYPDYVEVHQVADSFGLCPVGQQSSVGFGEIRTPDSPCQVDPVSHPVYMVEITNEKSPMPLEERQALLFMLSIHGVEKGGREGGMRVMEDLLKGIGFAAETVQDGAGMPTPLAKPTGGEVEIYQDMLDFTRVFLLFPNTDGWVHDEAPYVTNDPSCGAPPNGVLFCRTNGNGVDLNRQAPTLGWQNPNRNVVGEPESVGYYNWMLENDIDWTYAIDIHGMNQHKNFGAIMLPAGSMTPQEMERSLGLAETLKQRLNNDPHFDEWLQLMTAAEQATGATAGYTQTAAEQACEAEPETGSEEIDGSGCFLLEFSGATNDEPTSHAVGSSQFAEYYTVIDAIGYTDSGFNGDFFAQNTGLNAPGYDIELAYNHLTGDSQYNGITSTWNDYHVKMVREIVKSYLDAASLDVTVRLDTGGSKTLVLENPTVVTNLDDVDANGLPFPELPADSWAAQNPSDDLWDYSAETPFTARPHKYWEDMKPYVTDGEAPGVLNYQRGSGFDASTLAAYDTFVIPGSALDVIAEDASKIQLVHDWVEAGGTLVLTDSALEYLNLTGLTPGGVNVEPRYMGGIKVAPYAGHELLETVRGGVMQMYEPTPLGYGVTSTAPNWFVDEEAWTAIGGEIAGRECGLPSLNTARCDDNGIGLGQVAVGEGTIRIMGSLLPDPSEEFYHAYGVDHYATTYSGNAIMLNMLGFQKIYSAPTVVITDEGTIVETPNEPTLDSVADGETKDTPALGGALGFLALAGAAFAARRRL